METNRKENSQMAIIMDLENLLLQGTMKMILITTLDNIKMTTSMAKESLYGDMEYFMKVDFKMASNQEMELNGTLIETNMKENW